jgi:nitrate/nitrite transporter NarK
VDRFRVRRHPDGRIAERVGVRWTVIFGALMIAVGLALSTLGPSLPLYVGHGLFIGLIGIGGINAPSYVYVSRWFDRRRGSALALISSGSYLAGAIWPPVFAQLVAYAGWRHTMLYYGAFEVLLIVPPALMLQSPPDVPHHAPVTGPAHTAKSVMGWPPNLVFALQMCAIFTCCIPMSMPQAHPLAFCTDHGISAAHGAAMVSVLLGAAFFSRQVWGVISDRGPLHYARRVCFSGLGHARIRPDAGRSRAVHCFGHVWRGLQRSGAGQCARLARIVSRRRRLLAHADAASVQRFRNGDGRLARRSAL